MNKMKLALVVLTAAFFSACGIAEPEIPAVATSDADETVAVQEAEATPDQTASSDTTSPLCMAIENIVAFPFDTYSFGDLTAASDASAIRSAATSYRAVAAALPDDAPYVIATFFAAAPDTVEDTIGQSLDDLALDPDHLPDVVVLGSIDMQDVERYVATKCPTTDFAEQPFTPLFTVEPHPLATPSHVEFCMTWATFASHSIAVGTTEGIDAQLAMINTANETLIQALHLMEVDTPRRTAAYLRIVSFRLTNIQSPSEEMRFVNGLLWHLDVMLVRDELLSLCPDVEDPWLWLLAFFPGSDPTASPRDESDEGIVIELGTPDGTLTVGGVVLNLDFGEFERASSSGEAEGAPAPFVRLEVSFDRPPSDELIPVPADVVLVAPDGTEFPADAGQSIYPHIGSIRFAVDREVRTLTGWTLRSGDATLDLG